MMYGEHIMQANYAINCRFRLHLFPAENTEFKDHLTKILVAEKLELSSPNQSDDLSHVLIIVFVISKYDDILIQRIRQSSHEGRVIIVTQPGFELQESEGMSLLNAGASDAINWHDEESTINIIKGRAATWTKIDQVLCSREVQIAAVGQSKAWTETLKKVIEVANYCIDPVLIAGETGTGKELVARLIHDLDPREDKGEYTILDCASIVPELSGSEFFGHEKGAFTGAIESRRGVFDKADKGSLFLDEVGELSPNLQAQLLRILEEGTYQRVGSNTWFSSNFRLICATNRNLIKAVREGCFRQDLYYRLANWVIELPPLRERVEDIPLLARYFLSQIDNSGSTEGFDLMVEDYLLNRNYPGNVRELKSLVGRLAQDRGQKSKITLGCIPIEERPAISGSSHQRLYQQLETAIQIGLSRNMDLDRLLEMTTEVAARIKVNEEKRRAGGGNISRPKILKSAGKALGRTQRTMEDYDKKYNLLQSNI
jgi:transcriptional regulator with GAF, ATPase, and Fis domain